MTKSIYTLIPDIYALLQRKDGWFDDELSRDLSESITSRLAAQLGAGPRTPTLRLSQMGPRCPRQLWYGFNKPECEETLPSWAIFKYSFGHVLEALGIALAKAAGHTVTGEQDELVVDGVSGHRDCVIDGCVVDVKSSSSYGFNKFKDGSIRESDSFGYLDQLDGYVVGSLDDPLVTVKDKGYLLVIDKQLGHMYLYEHRIREQSIRTRIQDYRRIIQMDEPPACTCGTVPHGKSGNIALDTKASYSLFKHCCFPNLRTFLYADGPKYLTKVVKVPDVPEVHRTITA